MVKASKSIRPTHHKAIMNRRNLIKTIFGSGIAASLGLVSKVKAIPKENIVEKSVIKGHSLSFETFFKIVTGFEINEIQKRYYEDYQNNNHNSFSWERQTSGMSTFFTTLALWEALKGKNVIYLNWTLNCGRLQQMNIYDMLDKLMVASHRSFIERNQQGRIEFYNGGSVTFQSSYSSCYMRGMSPDVLLLDNVRYNKSFDYSEIRPIIHYRNDLKYIEGYTFESNEQK